MLTQLDKTQQTNKISTPKERFQTQMTALKKCAREMPNTPLLARAKVQTIILLNMVVEKVAFGAPSTEDPHLFMADLLASAVSQLKAWSTISFIENPNKREILNGKPHVMEEKHYGLFQELWVNFDEKAYDQRIERYVHRLKVNDLFSGFLKNKRCIDLGCGHGNFAHALLRAGAANVTGIDYGEGSIAYAKEAQKNLKETRLEFTVGDVSRLPYANESFHFAIQNGVFHHLNVEEPAIREAHRVLKVGGHLWYFTDGGGGMTGSLADTSVELLRDIPHAFVNECIKELNVSTEKQYHLGDLLNATYRRTTLQEITSRLESFGFGNVRRLQGGFSTDPDGDLYEKHPWAKQWWGDGDLRLLAEKVR